LSRRLIKQAKLVDGKFVAEGDVDPEWLAKINVEYVSRDFGSHKDKNEPLARSFIYHDDGKDRGDDWRKPRIGPREEMTQEWVDAQRAKRSWLDTDQLLGMWDLRPEKDDRKTPGVPSDMVHFIWDGELFKNGEENDALRNAQVAIQLLNILEPDIMRRSWWDIRHEITTTQKSVPIQGAGYKSLTIRKSEYSENSFPYLKVNGALTETRYGVWLSSVDNDPLFLAAVEYVKPIDRVTSWVEACNKYSDSPILRKGGDALDMLAKRFRPLVGRIVKEFWGRSKEVLTGIGMLG
jgi:hypothetical protein